MDTIICILGNLIGIAFLIFCVIFAIGMWNYACTVMGYNKKHKDEDEDIVIKFKIEDVEPKRNKHFKGFCDYDEYR